MIVRLFYFGWFPVVITLYTLALSKIFHNTWDWDLCIVFFLCYVMGIAIKTEIPEEKEKP